MLVLRSESLPGATPCRMLWNLCFVMLKTSGDGVATNLIGFRLLSVSKTQKFRHRTTLHRTTLYQ